MRWCVSVCVCFGHSGKSLLSAAPRCPFDHVWVCMCARANFLLYSGQGIYNFDVSIVFALLFMRIPIPARWIARTESKRRSYYAL